MRKTVDEMVNNDWKYFPVKETKDFIEWSQENIRNAALISIARSLKVMERNYAELVSDRDNYRKLYHSMLVGEHKLRRSNSALRGVITKLRNK